MNTYGRIYKNFSLGKLLRLKTFFMTCKFQFVVKNLGKVYEISSGVLGKKLVNNIIKCTYADIFLAGENSKDLEVMLRSLKNQGLIGIADYAREFLTKEEEEKEIEEIIKHYKESIDASIRVSQENSIAMKISSFGNVDTLKRLNECQHILTTIENNLEKSFDSLLDILNTDNLDVKLTREAYESLQKEKKEFFLNLYESVLSNNAESLHLIKSILGLKSREVSEFKKYICKLDERLMQVFSHAKKQNCLIMIDAEQSYLRFISDVIVAFYFKSLNKDSCILAHTLQCYLKTQQNDLRKWLAFTRNNKLKFGLKLVRGAYMNEEEKLARQKGLESPVCPEIENTHQNYDQSIQFVFDNYKEGDKFCIATHNLESIRLTSEMYITKGRNENIFCAQLLGIAEHAAGYCIKNDVKVAKYVPFGNFDILIPYLIRRAEESSMLQKLTVQNSLLNEEICLRFLPLKNYFVKVKS